ncbi:MAG TPA: hypothetical protein VD926_09070 [Acidimicrobiales bacterium]|nr:hypothetical protein [Acidimicrobiales bacterium]
MSTADLADRYPHGTTVVLKRILSTDTESKKFLSSYLGQEATVIGWGMNRDRADLLVEFGDKEKTWLREGEIE